MPDPNGLDHGIKCDEAQYIYGVHPEVRVEELEKELREEKKQHFELSIKFDEMKAQLEELRKWKTESYHEELKRAYEEKKVDYKEMQIMFELHHRKWYNTLSLEEQEVQDKVKYVEGMREYEINTGFWKPDSKERTTFAKEYDDLLKKNKTYTKKPKTPKPQILDLDSLIDNAPEGKLIQVSDETKEKLNTKGKN